jgi:L-iditol 2-dehydrogenase
MRALRLHGPHDLRLHDELRPTPRQGEQLLRVTAVGICGSDLRWFSAGGIGDATLSQPLVLGHEFAAVTPSGGRVAVDPAIPCRKCEDCMRGHPNLCAEVRFAGHGSVDGALREYLAWDERCLFPLPDSMTDEDGVMLEPLGVAMHAVRLASLEAGMTAAVFGCGPIGLLTIQLARSSGARVLLATDRLAGRVAAAREFGAGQAHLVEGRLDPGAIRAATGGRGVDAAFEVAGDQGAVDDAFASVAIGGKVILAGIPDDDRTSFSASVARRKGLTIKLVRRMKSTYPQAIALVSQRRVDVRSLVTHRFPLSEAREAFLAAERREGLKVIATVGGGH